MVYINVMYLNKFIFQLIRNFWVNYSFEDIKADGRMLAMPTLPFRFSFDDRNK